MILFSFRRLQERKNSETSVISSSSVDVSNQNRGNSLSQTPEKQGGAPGPANFFANLKTLFTPGNQNPNSALKIDVPAPPCFAAVLPKRSIYEWVFWQRLFFSFYSKSSISNYFSSLGLYRTRSLFDAISSIRNNFGDWFQW